MNIDIPSWLAYILIAGKVTVYTLALYLFVRYVVRDEIGRALPPAAEPEQDEGEPAPQRSPINVTINVGGTGSADDLAKLRVNILKIFEDAASVEPKDGAS